MVTIIEDVNVPGLGKIIHTECNCINPLEEKEKLLREEAEGILSKIHPGNQDEDVSDKLWDEYNTKLQEAEEIYQKLHSSAEYGFCKEYSYLNKKLEALHSVGANVLTAEQLALAQIKSLIVPKIEFKECDFEGNFYDGFIEIDEAFVSQYPNCLKIGHHYREDKHTYVYHIHQLDQLLSCDFPHLAKEGTYVKEGVLFVPGKETKFYLLRESLDLINPGLAETDNLGKDFDPERFLASLPPEDYLALEREEDLLPVRYEDFGSDRRTRWLFGKVAEEYGLLLGQAAQRRSEGYVAYRKLLSNSLDKSQTHTELLSSIPEELPSFKFDPFLGMFNKGLKDNGIKSVRESYLEKPSNPFNLTLLLQRFEEGGEMFNPFSSSINGKSSFVRGLIPGG